MGWKKQLQTGLLTAFVFGCASDQSAIQISPLPSVVNQFELTSQWSQQIGDGVGTYYSRLRPVYAYDKVFAADRQGLITAIDQKTGEPVWNVDLGIEKPVLISSGIVAAYDKIFVGTEMGFLIALEADTGNFLWQTDVGGELLSQPLVDSNLVIVNSSRGVLSAFDAETGTQKWQIANDIPNLTLRGDSSPVATSGGVFWGLANGRLSAAFVENGNLLWQQVIASPKGATEIDRLVDVDSSPVISDYLLYALAYNGHLVAIDLRSGQLVWKREYSSANDFTLVGNTIYLISDKDHVVSVDARSGTELWSNTELEHRQLTAPVMIHDKLVVGDYQGYLHWIDPKSGEFIAQHSIDKSGFSVAPIAVEDNILVITRDGELSTYPVL